jgi:hypothetical protein
VLSQGCEAPTCDKPTREVDVEAQVVSRVDLVRGKPVCEVVFVFSKTLKSQLHLLFPQPFPPFFISPSKHDSFSRFLSRFYLL